MFRWRTILLVMAVTAIPVLAAACQAADHTVPEPSHTPDLGATVAAVVAMAIATDAPPTSPVPPQPVATSTPIPTPTPSQVPTDTPLPTATARPTPAPTLTPTSVPTPAATLPPESWSASGYWFRDVAMEIALKQRLVSLGVSQSEPVYSASLDANPEAFATQSFLTLACLLNAKVLYLTPYSYAVPPMTDAFKVGIWDISEAAWIEDAVLTYYDPGFTDDGSAIFINNQSQIRQILDVIREAERNPRQGRVLSAVIYEEGNDEAALWSDFDPTGLPDALQYLPCF